MFEVGAFVMCVCVSVSQKEKQREREKQRKRKGGRRERKREYQALHGEHVVLSGWAGHPVNLRKVHLSLKEYACGTEMTQRVGSGVGELEENRREF